MIRRLLWLLLLAGCAQDELNHALERMDDQPRYDVYERSGFFPDGKVMQRPPPGTVPRDTVNPALGSYRTAGSYVGRMPIPVTLALVARGESRFRIYCAACHGVGGFGGSVVARNMAERRPPNLRSPRIRAYPPGRYFDVITNGFGRMPSYAAELPVRDRWAVIAYLRRLQRRTILTAEERADSVSAEEIRVMDSLLAARRAAEAR